MPSALCGIHGAFMLVVIAGLTAAWQTAAVWKTKKRRGEKPQPHRWPSWMPCYCRLGGLLGCRRESRRESRCESPMMLQQSFRTVGRKRFRKFVMTYRCLQVFCVAVNIDWTPGIVAVLSRTRVHGSENQTDLWPVNIQITEMNWGPTSGDTSAIHLRYLTATMSRHGHRGSTSRKIKEVRELR